MALRCFVAIDLDNPALLDTLEGIQASMIRTGADLKCVERDNIHVTLKFLGDVREELIGELIRRVSEISFKPFNVELKGVGVFPSLRRPRVVWAGISEGKEELKEVFQILESELTGIGFKPEKRRFSPHITIARIRSGRNRDHLVKVLLDRENEKLGDFNVESIRLKKSVLTPKGPIYSTLAESKVSNTTT